LVIILIVLLLISFGAY
ncbi:type I toxin-antitoxin system Ibs family toxin, partial [Escherichia coli]